MKELYSWIPWFAELAKSIADGTESDLVQRAHKVRWKADESESRLLSYGDHYVDPFSFLYTLAATFATKHRVGLCESVQSVFALSTPPPHSDDACIFPKGALVNALFHSGNDGNPDLLWRLFRAACDGAASINAADFRGALEIRNVGLPKLTQTLFLMNPSEFMPLDDRTRMLLPNSSIKVDNWESYQATLDEIRNSFPGCKFYEANLVAWLIASGEFSTVGQNIYQVSTNVDNDASDKWPEFETENAVWTGGPGQVSWEEFVSGTKVDSQYPLEEPKPGDLILIRYAGQGHAIGLVYRNDYTKELSSKARLHVVWINRRSVSKLLDNPRNLGFSHARKIANQFFANEAYRPTKDLLDRLQAIGSPEPPISANPFNEAGDTAIAVTEPLNQILYGPPGTGKTFRTTDLAVSIVDPGKGDGEHTAKRKRLDELRFNPQKGTGNIALVTFHQNFAYEDFVEGIRPVLGEVELRYELRDGIFKQIAQAAIHRPKERFVLIIDEINRGNIAKIFGELITLIEDSRRAGSSDATSVTLPYSQKPFTVPANLYLIGTMNTADRSIQLLDTALRRRFKFLECMPDPQHEMIPTDIEGVNCQQLLEVLNERIALLLDREHQIGHTYFLDINSLPELADVFRYSVFPLLQEYFFDDWAKIKAVLGNNGFVGERKPDQSFLESNLPDLVDNDRKVYERLADNDELWTSSEAYQAIYQKSEITNSG